MSDVQLNPVDQLLERRDRLHVALRNLTPRLGNVPIFPWHWKNDKMVPAAPLATVQNMMTRAEDAIEELEVLLSQIATSSLSTHRDNVVNCGRCGTIVLLEHDEADYPDTHHSAITCRHCAKVLCLECHGASECCRECCSLPVDRDVLADQCLGALESAVDSSETDK
jgi:hypothetical protein